MKKSIKIYFKQKGGLFMKKQFLLISMLLSATVLFSGCSRSAPFVSEAQEPPQSPQTPTPNHTSDMVAIPTTVSEDQNTVTNLTEKNNVGICIDYAISSYASIQNFSYQLFEKNQSVENPVLSPVSAYLALSMAGFGADGNTREEFLKLLGEDMACVSDDLMNTLPKNTQNTKVSLANSAWIDNQFVTNQSWVGEIKSLMDAQAFQSNLSSTETMNSINDWIRSCTNGLIDSMLSEPLASDTQLVLFNTLYFKAKWDSPFEKIATYTDHFTLANSEIVDVEMMHKSNEMLNYISNDFAEGLIFPYQSREESDGNLVFIALKPTTSDIDIRKVSSLLTKDVLSELLATKQSTVVNTKIPKFEITFEKDLNESLQSMGLQEAFDQTKANLGNLGTTPDNDNLYISLVRQKAKVIVDENGTEAAAATEVAIMKCTALNPTGESIDVYFDEPFLYIIMDMDKEIPLFIGILDNPVV